MAATARSELYNGLVRKVGYSVGLEYLTRRVSDLVDLYISQGDIDGADWRHLVKSWGRKPSAEQHIADVYAQLELIRRQNNSIQILPALEVLGILYTEGKDGGGCPDSEGHSSALKFILSQKVLEADGDIFLNALEIDFEPSELLERLQELIRYKRTTIRPLFKQAGAIRRVMESISIKNQTESAGKPKRISYAEQSRLLWSLGSAGTARSTEWSEQEVFISDDYVEKICVTRRGWAEDLGLFDRSNRQKTELGLRLLKAANEIGLSFNTRAGTRYAFWPYGYELRRMSLAPEEIGVRDVSTWSVIEMLADIFVLPRAESSRGGIASTDREYIVSKLIRAQSLYRGISRRGAIRHELPLFVAEPVLAFWMKQSGQKLPDLRKFLRSEFSRRDRLVDFVMIRGTEGGLRLMAKGGSSGHRK